MMVLAAVLSMTAGTTGLAMLVFGVVAYRRARRFRDQAHAALRTLRRERSSAPPTVMPHPSIRSAIVHGVVVHRGHA